MSKARDITETIHDVRKELDNKIESKVPIWIFVPLVLLIFGTIGAAYWHCMTQILSLTEKISAVEAIVTSKAQKTNFK